MKITLKNIFNITPFSFFLAKISFTILFIVAHARTVANMDASHPWQIGFQDPATPIMEGIIFFNGLLMTFMIFIACLVGWLLYKCLTLFDESKHANPVGFTHSTLLEVVWTIIPAAILMVISIPSYNLLYAMDEVIDPSLTIKVVGHQWYWSYECSDFEVAPKTQKEYLELLEGTKNSLNVWIDLVSDSNGNITNKYQQTKINLIKELLNFLDKDNINDLPKEAYHILLNRLTMLNAFIIKEEGILDSFSGDINGLFSVVKSKLETGSVVPEKQELVIKALETFKESLKSTELDSTGSDNNDKSSDNDSDDDGSIITDLMDFDKSNPYWEWCELASAEAKYENDDADLTFAASEAFTSERICTNAALDPEKNNTPFSELMENMKQDMRQFRKAIPVADLSEDKLIDTQLIEHQLRLTREEREGFSSKFALDGAVTALNFAEFEYNNALSELNNAKLHSHWSQIELAAANVNKLTAEYLQADASVAVTDPLLIRSVWINKKGYYSWNEFLRLAIKKLSDAEKLVFLNADEELNGANSLLGKAQRTLTLEERNKSNAIADNAKAEFMAMEKEVIPAIEEFMRGKEILANAKSELKTFQEIADRADTRLEKAQLSFDEAKPVWDRAKAKLNAAEAIYNSAKAKLTNSESNVQILFNKDNLEIANIKFDSLKEEFNKALLNVQSAKSDLLIAQDRVETVKANFEKTEKVFEETGLLEKQRPVEGKPTEYYPNYLWEIHNEDLAFVKAQLATDKAELDFANTSLEAAEKHLSYVSGELLEAELVKNKALINSLEIDLIDVNVLNEVKNHLAGIKLNIAEAIFNKALANFKAEGSENSKLILERAQKGLTEARLDDTSGYSGSVLDNNLTVVDSNKLILDYAESCIVSTKEQLNGAESDYLKASSILKKAEVLLENVGKDLNKEYDNPYLDTLKALHKNTTLSLKGRIEQLNNVKSESSPLDIKLEPGLLQSKSYKEVLLAKAELANIKWLCARVSKTLDIPLSEEVKPFNVQFSYLKPEDSSMDGLDNNSEEGSSASGSGDKKDPKSLEEIKAILLQLQQKKASPEVLKTELLNILSGILKASDKKEDLVQFLDNALKAIITEESDKNDAIKTHIAMIKGELDYCLESASVEEDDEEEKERINFDSYLIADDDLIIPEALGTGKAGTVFRLLEVDNRLFVPTNTHIRLLITSADVLHSWAVPSLGVKVDACPGRLNQVFMFVKREGVFYGQCSELCGVNHGFMPIVVQAVSQDEYLTWVGKRLCS